MTISPDMLRQLTDEAIQRGKKLVADKLESERLAAEHQRVLDVAEAELVISQIPHKAEVEATVGRSHAIVMGLNYSDVDGDVLNSNATTAQIVWDWCKKAGLKPNIESWDDGVGVRGGHNIVIHW